MADRQSMRDIYDIIDEIMQDDKLSGGKVYRDEPILRPASQIPRPDTQRNKMPERIAEMKRLSYSEEMMWKPREYVFYQQAKLMEDYEDTYIYRGRFEMFYPTYGAMTTEQLRGYFTWRAAVRRGEVPPSGRSYIFIYLYELVNSIGVSSPEEGLERLKKAQSLFGTDPTVMRYLKRWTEDYIIYHRLPPELLEDADRGFDEALLVLMKYKEQSDDALFGAIDRLSGYNFAKTPFYSDYPDDLRDVVCGVYRALAEHCGTHNKKSLHEKYFGRRVACIYTMFQGAVFYDTMPDRSFEYRVNELRRYEYRGGVWYSDMFMCEHNYSKQLHELVRAVDYYMRERYKYKHRLSGCTATKIETKLIENALNELAERKKREEAARIDIDISKLGGIRHASDVTRDKLIVDEEEQDIPEPEIPEAPQAEGPANDTPLDENEYRFMQCLLYGGDCNEAAKAAGTMPSLLADVINEKLFDTFGDTVLDLSGGEPAVIEDYEEELKGMISE